MSRRESCVWHPMPEEVRRSSIQSRRASLAAGRRKSVGAHDQPDWEVEAPPTPPPVTDFSPRQPEDPSKGWKVKDMPRPEDRESAACIEEEAPAAARAPIGPVESDNEPEVDDGVRCKTRHTVRFRGSEWGSVMADHADELRNAFVKDIVTCTGEKAEDLKDVKLELGEGIVATFVMLHPRYRRKYQQRMHAAIKQYKFPRVCNMYPLPDEDVHAES